MNTERHKAVVFTHFPISNAEEFKTAEIEGKLEALVEHTWGKSILAFDKCDNIGLVYLFLPDAYKAFVTGSENFDSIVSLERSVQHALRQFIGDVCENKNKFEIVGFRQLEPLLTPLEKLAENSEISLNELVLGGGSKMNYDCPKVVEAIIRLARRHQLQPILRFDVDVLVNREGVERLISHHERLLADNVRYFFFSGNYHAHKDKDSEKYWINDYAIRTHFLSTSDDGKPWSFYKDQDIDRSKISFNVDTKMAKHFIEDMQVKGADPMDQVISGAGLCISPMAITQLPPFANVTENIVWIDDAIKRALHEGIGDIPTVHVGAVEEARFEQERHPTGITLADVDWGYNNYLPRLVYGCLMYSTMVDIKTTPPTGPFAEYFIDYMRNRKKTKDANINEWAERALERVKLIKANWTDPRFAASDSGKILTEFAEKQLDYNGTKAEQDFMADIVKNPDQDIAELCSKYNISSKCAVAYVGEVVADLNRYIELMNVWPYIIRLVDFETRTSSEQLEWLTKPCT
jgi:hypothetical protein